MAKVVIGMSGGVDSSVASYLLKEHGYEVEGLSFILWEARGRTNFTTCCSLEAMNGAANTAERLGIKHTAMDVRDQFIEKVIEPFIEAYTQGLTPNPCILCNKHIKFPFLVREAEKKGAEYISTGHYAVVERSQELADEKIYLKKGTDPKKDQSYFLYIIKQYELSKLLLPLGGYKKKEVREIAFSLNLDAANRQESQEICFIEDKNYFKFVEMLSPIAGKPGPIIDKNGKILGTHRGIYCYTIGQRKGLGLSSLEPYYVIKIDTLKNAVYVGSREDARIAEIFVDNLNWLIYPKSNSFRATVKVRSMMEDKPASIFILNERARVVFDEPQWAPAPGQSAVFYSSDKVMGGGIIAMQVNR